MNYPFVMGDLLKVEKSSRYEEFQEIIGEAIWDTVGSVLHNVSGASLPHSSQLELLGFQLRDFTKPFFEGSDDSNYQLVQEHPIYKKWPDHENPEYDPATVNMEGLCNFPQWFPGGIYRNAEIFQLDVVHRKIAGDDLELISKLSPKFLNETRKQTIEAIDQAIIIAEISKEKANTFYEIGACTSAHGVETEDELLLYKVYEILRKQGYHQYELTA